MTTTRKTNGKTAKPAKTVEDAMTASKETVEAVVEAGTVAATKSYDQAVAMTKEQVEKTSKAMFEGYGDFSDLGQQNYEAMVKSGTIYAKGFETIGQEMMEFTRSSIEGNVSAAKAIMGAKNIKEMVDLQSEFARKSIDQAVAEYSKLTEMSMKLASDAMAPIQARVEDTTGKMWKPVSF
ncbi:MAG: phasin family protein [Kiloniellales bacterium]|nr:phasin family protein [Kiloniellales bacterium]